MGRQSYEKCIQMHFARNGVLQTNSNLNFDLINHTIYYCCCLKTKSGYIVYILVYECFAEPPLAMQCLHPLFALHPANANKFCIFFFGVCLPIMKSHPVKSFHEKTHSSSFDESFDILEFSAILRKDIKKMDNN